MGSLRPGLSYDKLTEAGFSTYGIRNASVLTTPGTRIEDMLAASKFKKV